jgi:hypothetical protein
MGKDKVPKQAKQIVRKAVKRAEKEEAKKAKDDPKLKSVLKRTHWRVR